MKFIFLINETNPKFIFLKYETNQKNFNDFYALFLFRIFFP